jgi:hypothetical protein
MTKQKVRDRWIKAHQNRIRKVASDFLLKTDRFDLVKKWDDIKSLFDKLDEVEEEENFCIFLQSWPQVSEC